MQNGYDGKIFSSFYKPHRSELSKLIIDPHTFDKKCVRDNGSNNRSFMHEIVEFYTSKNKKRYNLDVAKSITTKSNLF